jgi:hypothetical protein
MIVPGVAYYHMSCGGLADKERRDRELQVKYPLVPLEVLVGINAEDCLSSMSAAYCVVLVTRDNEWGAHGFKSEAEAKAFIARHETEDSSWDIHSVYHSTKPMKFKIETKVSVTLQEGQ